jgi:hypothetical protein
MSLRCARLYWTYVQSDLDEERAAALATLRAEAPALGLLCYPIHQSAHRVVAAMARMTQDYFDNCLPALPLRDPSPVVFSSGFVAAQGVQRVAPDYRMVRLWLHSSCSSQSAG